MAYCLERDESVSKAVRRLGRERIGHAIESLKDYRQANAVHCTRKDIKKLRAVLRLVRTRIGKRQYRRLTRQLREAAAHVAALRDAHAKATTLRAVAGHFKARLAPGVLRQLRSRLRQGIDEEM